jgi:hypothetical protein
LEPGLNFSRAAGGLKKGARGDRICFNSVLISRPNQTALKIRLEIDFIKFISGETL